MSLIYTMTTIWQLDRCSIILASPSCCLGVNILAIEKAVWEGRRGCYASCIQILNLDSHRACGCRIILRTMVVLDEESYRTIVGTAVLWDIWCISIEMWSEEWDLNGIRLLHEATTIRSQCQEIWLSLVEQSPMKRMHCGVMPRRHYLLSVRCNTGESKWYAWYLQALPNLVCMAINPGEFRKE